MASLTEVSLQARRIIRLIILGTIGYLILQIVLTSSINLYKKINPAPPPLPKEEFGTLPEIIFPDQQTVEFEYALETIDGTPPNLGDRTQVYFMPSFRRSLLGLELANQQAIYMNLPFQPEKIDEQNYRWTSSSPPITLNQNITTGSLIYILDWFQSPQIFNRSYQFPNQTQVIKEARQILSRFRLNQTDLEGGQAQVTYLKKSNNTLIPALSPSDAEAVKVDLFRAPINELPVIPSNPSQALVSITFTNTRDGIIKIDYIHYPVDLEKSSDYPLKTTAQAWQELKENQAYIASFPFNADQVITIREIELSYFESSAPANYLQPIYIFRGDNNFIAYIPAIQSSP